MRDFWIMAAVVLVLMISLSVTVSSVEPSAAQETGNTNRDSTEAKIDSIFSECNKPASPGAAIVILKDGQTVLSKGYGIANLDCDIPITPSTVFWVASLSKQFTAMAITILEKQGRLSIDDEIHHYLPELPDFGAPITIRHLLHHMSGLRDDLTMWILAGNQIEDIITQRDLFTLIQHQKQLNFLPGSKYSYSDTNYLILAEIVTRVTGESFATWVQRNIFLPLGMTSSCFIVESSRPIRNRAYCYKRNGAGEFRNVCLNMNYVGATGLLTTAEDMAKWVLNLESGKVGGGEVLKAMLTQGVLNNGEQITYARGLRIDSYKDRKVIRHSGTDASFNSHMSYFPDERLGIVVLSNFESNPWDMADEVADLFLPATDESAGEELEEGLSESRLEPVAVMLTDDQLAACAGTYWYSDSWNWLVRHMVVEDNTIYYVRSDDNRSELIPISENEFLLADNDKLVVRFSHMENGHFTDLTFNATSQQPLQAVRVERFEPSEEDLSEYEGIYYAEELDAMHRLVVRKGEIYNIKFRSEPDTHWRQVVKDRFTFMDGDGHVTFRRDAQGQIVGYVIDFPRAQNIMFEKLR